MSKKAGKFDEMTPKQIRAHNRQSRRFLVALVTGVGLIMLAIFVGFPATSAYDKDHTVDIECTVRSASGRVSSSGGRVASSSHPEVFIETTDCGSLSLTKGITEENMSGVAGSIQQGSRYRFKMGQSTHILFPFWEFANFTSNIQGVAKE